jgi:hypothetical protein
LAQRLRLGRPPSGVWRREPELRFILRRDSGWQYEFGVGNPGTEATINTDVDDQVQPANQSMSDVIGALYKTTGSGHFRITGVYRDLKHKSAGREQTVAGDGATVSGFIDAGDEVVTRLQKNRSAQRISFGMFFDF